MNIAIIDNYSSEEIVKMIREALKESKIQYITGQGVIEFDELPKNDKQIKIY